MTGVFIIIEIMGALYKLSNSKNDYLKKPDLWISKSFENSLISDFMSVKVGALKELLIVDWKARRAGRLFAEASASMVHHMGPEYARTHIEDEEDRRDFCHKVVSEMSSGRAPVALSMYSPFKFW
jgi:hypothetical protein